MGSKSGSISCLTTIWAMRSLTVGTPKILSPPLFFGNGDSAHRRWKVGSRAHSVPYLVEVALQVGFELLDCLPVHAGRTLVGFDRFVRFVHSPFLDRERLVCRIRRRHPVSSCFAEHDHLTRPLCSSPITGPSTLLRVDPSQSPASVLSPRGFRRLCFSLAIRGWFLQFRAKAYVRLTPPLRRSPSAQSSGPRRTCPRRDTRPWF